MDPKPLPISQVTKKILMALTGLFMYFFLLLHLYGNLHFFDGEDSMNSYSEALASLGVLLIFFEVLLVSAAIIHISAGIHLFFSNLGKRPVRYRLKKSAGGKTITSSLAPYTGLLILIFITIHISDFFFSDKSGGIYMVVKSTLSNSYHMAFYIAAMIFLGLHITHGLWSAFQTLGLNDDGVNRLLKLLSMFLGLILPSIFASVPLYLYFV